MGQFRIEIIKNVLYSHSFHFLHSRKKFCTRALEYSYINHDHIEASFIFLSQKDFYTAREHIGEFCLFLLEKDFGTFRVLLFETLLYLSFYIRKKKVLSVPSYALKISLYYMGLYTTRVI